MCFSDPTNTLDARNLIFGTSRHLNFARKLESADRSFSKPS
jgi:hypothetical protein